MPSAYRSKRSHFAPSQVWIVAFGLLVGGGLGYFTMLEDRETALYKARQLVVAPFKTSGGTWSWAFYVNCSHARLAGAAPISRGNPGYATRLDADNDGIACEPYVTNGGGHRRF